MMENGEHLPIIIHVNGTIGVSVSLILTTCDPTPTLLLSNETLTENLTVATFV
jgi:hypothetical protein